jgi:endonuclease/exonuclease/phosphatase family metal-dependent hydrolase
MARDPYVFTVVYDLERIAALLGEMRCDVAALQEVGP